MQLLISMPGGTEWVIILAIVLVPVLALVEILRSKFVHPENKIIWVLIVLLLPFIGPILYLLIGRSQKLR